MIETRTKIVKVRLSEAELARIDQQMNRAGCSTRADYLRWSSLSNGGAPREIAEILGRLGLAVNAGWPDNSKRLDLVRMDIAALTIALRDFVRVQDARS